MAEIQRAGRAAFEWVAGGRDMVEVQFGAAVDDALHRRRLEMDQGSKIVFDLFEKRPVTDQGHFDRFDVAGSFIERRKRGEEIEIINDSKRRRECANEVLFTEGVDAVFD